MTDQKNPETFQAWIDIVDERLRKQGARLSSCEAVTEEQLLNWYNEGKRPIPVSDHITEYLKGPR